MILNEAQTMVPDKNDVVVPIGISFMFLFCVDMATRWFIRESARYYFLHAVANMVVVWHAVPCFIRMILDPVDAMDGTAWTMIPNGMVVAIHLYHVLFFNLNFKDILHHCIFVSVLCSIAVWYQDISGFASPVGCLILSGVSFPDYIALVASKHGWIDKLSQKHVAVMINLWLRAPGSTIYALVMWFNLLYNPSPLPFLVGLLVALLFFINGQYYTYLIVESYFTHASLVHLNEALQIPSPQEVVEEKSTTESPKEE